MANSSHVNPAPAASAWHFDSEVYQFRFDSVARQAYLLTGRGGRLLDFPASVRLLCGTTEVFLSQPEVETGAD